MERRRNGLTGIQNVDTNGQAMREPVGPQHLENGAAQKSCLSPPSRGATGPSVAPAASAPLLDEPSRSTAGEDSSRAVHNRPAIAYTRDVEISRGSQAAARIRVGPPKLFEKKHPPRDRGGCEQALSSLRLVPGLGHEVSRGIRPVAS